MLRRIYVMIYIGIFSSDFSMKLHPSLGSILYYWFALVLVLKVHCFPLMTDVGKCMSRNAPVQIYNLHPILYSQYPTKGAVLKRNSYLNIHMVLSVSICQFRYIQRLSEKER